MSQLAEARTPEARGLLPDVEDFMEEGDDRDLVQLEAGVPPSGATALLGEDRGPPRGLWRRTFNALAATVVIGAVAVLMFPSLTRGGAFRPEAARAPLAAVADGPVKAEAKVAIDVEETPSFAAVPAPDGDWVPSTWTLTSTTITTTVTTITTTVTAGPSASAARTASMGVAAASGTVTTSTVTTTVTTTAVRGPSPKLFCWSHMEPGTDEVDLINIQLERRASIFACSGYAVISPNRSVIGSINGSDVVTWYNPEGEVGTGKYGVNGQKTDSFLNTRTFLQAWDSLIHSGQIWPYDFIVKVDPDAVFFPDRLRERVKDQLGEEVYYPNCGKWGPRPLLYGSLEVFSVGALRVYDERMQDCKNLPWKGWGEDYYMQHCMDILGVKSVPDFQQVGDERCIAAPCSDWTKVAYHDFKKPEDWLACFEDAIGGGSPKVAAAPS